MRRLINYIRSCFCIHDWELLAHEAAIRSAYSYEPRKQKWIYRCKKCGYKNIING